MILSYLQLQEIVEQGVMTNVAPDQINAASIDITVGSVFFIEENPKEAVSRHAPPFRARIGDTAAERVAPKMRRVDLQKGESLVLQPGQVALAQSEQVFNLPKNLSCKYLEKSSMGRTFLGHMMAGWCDAGWNGSVLTLELKNETQYHEIEIPVGVRIGQMIFFPHDTVPDEASYATRGRYNGDTETKGVKP